MICKHCGSNVPDDANFCTSCGAPIERTKTVVSVPYPETYSQSSVSQKPGVGIVDAITLFFRNYATFSGRARRSEYWWASLFLTVVSMVLANYFSTLNGLWGLATLVPSLSICARRLHDVGKSGWYYLWILLPIVGWIIVLVALVKDSDPGNNKYGPSPKYN